MSRVEVSENIGPHEVRSIGNASATTTSSVFHSSNFTIHSYQVIYGGSVGGSTDATFEIQCTNDDGGKSGDYSANATNWQTIASYDIDSGNNTEGIMYSDVWNFKYARCKITITTAGGLTSVDVIEKHNA